jgi:hypothetical protein
MTVSSRRTPGSIRRGPSFRPCCSRITSRRIPVVMGPGVRRDDEQCGAFAPDAWSWINFSNSQTTRHTPPPSRDAMRPSYARTTRPRGRGECRVPVAPAASRVEKNTRVDHHGYTGSPGIPARNGFNGFLRALPGDRACLSPSFADRSTTLTPASGRQDHTTSPSASKRFRQRRRLRPPHPVPNVRDDRDTPL